MGMVRPLVMAEPGIDRARRENQVIVRDIGQVGDQHDLADRVDARRGPHEGADPFHIGEHAADRDRDVGRRQGRGRDLVQQRLEEVVIGLVDDRDEGRRDRKAADQRQATEACADHHDPG